MSPLAGACMGFAADTCRIFLQLRFHTVCSSVPYDICSSSWDAQERCRLTAGSAYIASSALLSKASGKAHRVFAPFTPQLLDST